MEKIPDFSDTELWTLRNALKERYNEDVPIELADCEIRLNPSDRTLATRSGVYWEARGANFIIIKAGVSDYRSQFFYRGYQQYGTGKHSFDNITDCVVTLLQVQSDHERSQSEDGKGPGSKR